MAKILIVEDDKKLRKELETFLNKHGFMAKGLEKFDNTIQDILKENADLILLDINLPYWDGEFVCREVRKLSDVPIIMVTSRDNEIDELISLNYGADQYVTKPYNIQILLAKINGLLICDYTWLENLNLRGTFKSTIINYIKEKHSDLLPLYEEIYNRKNMKANMK